MPPETTPPAAPVRRALWANVLAYGAILLIMAGGLYFLDQRDAQRERDICGLIVITDDSYRDHPAQGSGGRAFAAAVHAYRLRIGC